VKSPLDVAVLQMATEDEPEPNARKIHAAIDRASSEGARVLVVPECALSGYLPAESLDFGLLERLQQELASHAAAEGLWLALGTTVRQGAAWRNAALLYSPEGRLAARYDKTHLTEADSKLFEAGQQLPVFRFGEWTLGMQICFDMRFAENWRILRRKNAELILHLSNASGSAPWKVPVLEGAIRSRAADNGMFVVSSNDARTPQMMVSAVCDPDGRDLARADLNREQMLFATLDRSAAKGDFLQRRRTDLWSRPENRALLLS